MDAPKYFLTVFGDPRPPEKDTIQSGVYHPHPRFVPFAPEPGDLLLLYCTAGYVEYAMGVPGLGVVLETSDSEIRYRYLPLAKIISKGDLENSLESSDKKKFANIRFSSHWLFGISKQSFLNAVADRGILWP